MKRLLVIMMTLGLALGASAQTKIRGEVPRVTPNSNSANGSKQQKVIIVSRRPYYNPYNSPFYGYSRFGYNPFGYGYNPYGFGQASVSVPTELELEIARIKSDYGYDISEVRHDKGIAKSERKKKIRDLKHERETAIIDAKRSYYKSANDRY